MVGVELDSLRELLDHAKMRQERLKAKVGKLVSDGLLDKARASEDQRLWWAKCADALSHVIGNGEA